MTTLPPLVSPDELATWLGVDAGDPQLIAALDAASARFRAAVRHPVSEVTGDEVTLDGNGAATLALPAAPVTDVHTVEVDGDEITDYEWSGTGMLYRAAGWPRRYRSVVVTYDHGYDPVPDDIVAAVLDQARAVYLIRPGVSQIQTGSENISFGAVSSIGASAQWSTAVELYRLNRGDRA
jgi:hypothetical protein